MEQSSNKTSEASMLIYGVLARKKNTTHSVKEKEHRKKMRFKIKLINNQH